MTKGNGVTHFTELHRTLHKNFLIWRKQMFRSLFCIRELYKSYKETMESRKQKLFIQQFQFHEYQERTS